MLERIALHGRDRIYNVAAGRNVTNREIMHALHAATGCAVEWAGAAPPIAAPVLSVERLEQEFGYAPRQLLQQFPSLVDLYRARHAGAAAQAEAG
jgi:hypothetical protein